MCLVWKHTSCEICFDLVSTLSVTRFFSYSIELGTGNVLSMNCWQQKSHCVVVNVIFVVPRFLGSFLGTHSLPLSAQPHADICTSPVFLDNNLHLVLSVCRSTFIEKTYGGSSYTWFYFSVMILIGSVLFQIYTSPWGVFLQVTSYLLSPWDNISFSFLLVKFKEFYKFLFISGLSA